MDGNSWAAECRFGDDKGTPGSKFDLVVIDGKNSLPHSGFTEEIPRELIRSETHVIRRNSWDSDDVMFVSAPKLTGLGALIPILKRRYIDRTNPPRGEPLPTTWLDEEVSHIDLEFRKQSLDDAEIDILKLPLRRDQQIIASPEELGEFQNALTNMWNRSGPEFTQLIEKLRNLAVNWLNFRSGRRQLAGPTGIIQLTPEVFASMQDQAKAAINRFRLHIVVLESLLGIALQEKGR